MGGCPPLMLSIECGMPRDTLIHRPLSKLLAAFAFALVATAANAGWTVTAGSTPQTAKAFTNFPNTVEVFLTDDASGKPRAGVDVLIEVDRNGVIIPASTACSSLAVYCVLRTDDKGRIGFVARALRVGRYFMTFYPPTGDSVRLDFTVIPATSVPAIELTAGGGQQVLAGTNGAKFKVRITRDGAPVQNDGIQFQIVSGPAKFPPFGSYYPPVVQVFTDASGIAESPDWVADGRGSGIMRAIVFSDSSGASPSIDIPYKSVDSAGQTFLPYKPLWWAGRSQAGWGVSIPQHGESILPIYYTYDGAGRPTWYLLEGGWSGATGGTYLGNLNAYYGAPYYAFDTARVKPRTSTPTSIDFIGSIQATMNLNLPANVYLGPPATMLPPLTPFEFPPATTRAELGVSDIWWGGPGQSGWGISIAEDRGNLFVAWYTYDVDGYAVWFAMPEGSWTDATTWQGPIYRTSGSGGIGGSYVAAMYRATKVGDFKLQFNGTSAATFTYSLEGHSGTLSLQRYAF